MEGREHIRVGEGQVDGPCPLGAKEEELRVHSRGVKEGKA